MRVAVLVSLGVLISGCVGISATDYITTGLRLANNPAELAEQYYEKIKENQQRIRRLRNLEALKAELDLQECGAVYLWLSDYYKKHDHSAVQNLDDMERKFSVTGIDRNYLYRVIHSRLGDGARKLKPSQMTDAYWIAQDKRLCDTNYLERVSNNPLFIAPPENPALY